MQTILKWMNFYCFNWKAGRKSKFLVNDVVKQADVIQLHDFKQSVVFVFDHILDFVQFKNSHFDNELYRFF